MKQFLLYFLLPVICQTSFSQSLSPSLLSIAGNSQTVSGYTVSYSVGELAVSTFYSNKGYILTQGFHQGNYNEQGHEGPLPPQVIVVNPNPVYESLYIDFFISDTHKFYVEVFNLKGMKLTQREYSDVVYGNKCYINMELIPKGLYFVHIYSDSGKISKVFKIVRM